MIAGQPARFGQRFGPRRPSSASSHASASASQRGGVPSRRASSRGSAGSSARAPARRSGRRSGVTGCAPRRGGRHHGRPDRHRRPDRERQVGARAAPGANASAARSSTPTACRSTASCRILTARPGHEDEARVPHRLYGVLGADEPGSAGRWLELAERAIGEALAAWPACRSWSAAPASICMRCCTASRRCRRCRRQRAPRPRRGSWSRAAPAFHAELALRDPVMARRLHAVRPPAPDRAPSRSCSRTGRSLAEWQAMPPGGSTCRNRWSASPCLPPRAELRARIAQRLQAMLRRPARSPRCGRCAPAIRTRPGRHEGAWRPELLAHLEGRLSLEEALARAIVQTRRYAKRQLTWLRHHCPSCRPVPAFGDEPEPPRAMLRCGNCC